MISTREASKLLGAKKACLCDISDDKVEFAKKSGIDCVVNTSDITLRSAAELAFPGSSADVIIDCVGAAVMLPQILETACKASTLVIVGNYSEPVTVDITKIQRNELDVMGCITYTPEDFDTAIQLIQSGKVYTDGFITGRYPIKDIQLGMEDAVRGKGRNMKTIFVF